MGGGLTQAAFAKRLAEAMDTLGVTGRRLAKALDADVSTISRYRKTDYKSGPPDATTRRVLEDELGLPRGYLDGTAKVDLLAVRRERRQETKAAPSANPEAAVLLIRTLRQTVEALCDQVTAQLGSLEQTLAPRPAERPATQALARDAALADQFDPPQTGHRARRNAS
jgi:transcriptional regulator with XRE-family HTH domain